MATSTRKRGATFLLEKPLVSRLPFEVEQPLSFSSTAFPPPRPKRVKPATAAAAATSSWRDDNLDVFTDVQSETSEMQETHHGEEADAADANIDVDGEKGCWLAAGKEKHEEGGKEKELQLHGAAAAAGGAAGNSVAPGPGRALVQLKIDAMFATPRLPPRDCLARLGQLSGAGPSGEADCAGAPRHAEQGMDLDSSDGGVVGVQVDAGEGGSSCYACRGGLGTEGGDVLCSFCDRAACQGCWQKCYACEVPHCTLCLAADYSSQFECYFCPPCYEDRRRELC